MSASTRRREGLPLVAGLLTALLGVALISSAAVAAMTVVGVGLLIAGLAVTLLGVLAPACRTDRTLCPQTGTTHDGFSSACLQAEPGMAIAKASRCGQDSPGHPPQGTSQPAGDRPGPLEKLVRSFIAWFQQQGTEADLWPSFDRWVRDALHQAVGARRIRCFHVTDDSHRLISLTNELEEPLWPAGGMPRLIEHVLATGRPYAAGDHGNGDLIERLAALWCADPSRTGPGAAAPHWLVPIRHGQRTRGLVLAGELPETIPGGPAGLSAPGELLGILWRQVDQAEALAVAERTDRTSGVLTRMDLSARAGRIIAEAAVDGEPVVLIALAVEGVRRLDDGGHWERRDQLMREVGGQLRRKLRSDDVVGRVSEDRFVAVLRRLDLGLGEMISRKLLAAVEAVVHQDPVLEEAIRFRCGLTCAGSEGFEAALSAAFQALQEARRENRSEPLARAPGREKITVEGRA